MNFTLTINCDNAAFEHSPTAEIASILHRTVADIQSGVEVGDTGTLRDANGNTVGRWQVTE